jgi:hypothetical protein
MLLFCLNCFEKLHGIITERFVKRQLPNPGSKWEDNIKIDHRNMMTEFYCFRVSYTVGWFLISGCGKPHNIQLG